MASYMKVILVGNLTRDPELKTVGETCVCDLGMAIDDSYKKKDGEKVEKVVFVDVVVWGRQAETAAEYLNKGSSVLIDGKLQLDQWENEAGEKRSKMRIRAERVQFLGSRDKATGTRPASVTDAPPSAAPPSAAPVEEFNDEEIPF